MKEERNERKKLMHETRSVHWKILHDWICVSTLNQWLFTLNNKYQLRDLVRLRTDKLLRILFVSFWAIGKFIRKFKTQRLKKLQTFVKATFGAKKGLWRLRRRIKAKKNLLKLVIQYEALPMLLIFIKTIIYKLCTIQKFYRRFYIKKQIMYNAMDIQWSYIEYVILKTRSREEDLKTAIENGIKFKQASNCVPLKIRIHYLRNCLNVILLIK